MAQPHKILKFGGTSLSSVDGLVNIREIIRSYRAAGESVAIVASALEDCTNLLLEMCRIAATGGVWQQKLTQFHTIHQQSIERIPSEAARNEAREYTEARLLELHDLLQGIALVHEVSPKTGDAVLAFGELLSAFLLTEQLRSEFSDALFLDARQIIRTDRTFSAAKVDKAETRQLIQAYFARHEGLHVVTGFIGATAQGETSTFGRGGSDYTAALLASALAVPELEIWTVVDGLMTADPQKVPKAFTIPKLLYQEAMELSHFGADVLFPPAIQPAMDAGTVIRIRNTLKPHFTGTSIGHEAGSAQQPVTGIASISDVALLRLEGSGMVGVAGVAKRLFDALSREAISVILISQASSEHSICFAIERHSAAAAKRVVDEEFRLEIEAHRIAPLTIDGSYSIIALVGANMRNVPGVSGRAFQALGKNGVNVAAIAQGSSELNISIVLDGADELKALGALHDAFFLSERKTVHLFLVGTGNVGKTLLSQIAAEQSRFAEQHLELRLSGLANSRRHIICPDGIPLAQWETALAKGEESDVQEFVARMKSCNLPNTVFVDCTASELVADQYPDILRASISIATPNKKANSATQASYRRLKETAKRANVKYFYETTVGAGLPVIGTLGDLLSSGDRVLRIDAVLSGTLSYLFNTFDGTTPFSSVVRAAKEQGYTEPDPRDDLSGTDVARKLLVLGREVGMALELEDVAVASLIPPCAADAGSVEAFLEALAGADAEFAERFHSARAEGKVLRHIGTLGENGAQVGLEAVGPEHPFYSLSGTDNVISFVTKRYYQRPLVVKGPGAGTDVTAAGVLADIIRIASYLG
ncbi:MAG: bifunctional aspartate kinase/homoserine dehydrogenase I [Bdellovibrionales bacterium]|nr:bifunctional aspartate kinase/homoserine dehydrogenase I [Bdellovibrionales bacterium]